MYLQYVLEQKNDDFKPIYALLAKDITYSYNLHGGGKVRVCFGKDYIYLKSSGT